MMRETRRPLTSRWPPDQILGVPDRRDPWPNSSIRQHHNPWGSIRLIVFVRNPIHASTRFSSNPSTWTRPPLPVKVLLVSSSSNGYIRLLQRSSWRLGQRLGLLRAPLPPWTVLFPWRRGRSFSWPLVPLACWRVVPLPGCGILWSASVGLIIRSASVVERRATTAAAVRLPLL